MRKAQLGFLTGTHVVNDLYQGAVPALLPFLMSERHYSYAAVSGIALAATGLSSVVQPVFGMIADRSGRDWLAPLGFLVAAAGIAAAGFADSYPLTWICVAVAGIGVAAYHPPATNQARAVGGKSQRAMSLFSVGGTLGSSLAPALVTAVVGSLGLSGTCLLAVPAVVMALLWLLNRRAGPVPPLGGSAAKVSTVDMKDDWRSFGRLVAATVGWSIPYVTVTSLLSLYAIRELHASTAAAAVTLTSFTLAGAAGTVLGGWLGDRFGRLTPIRAGYLLGVPALAGVVFSPAYPVLELSTVLLGLTMFLPFANQVTLAQDYLPARPGTASGLSLGLAMSAGGLASPLFGWLADARGLRFTLGAVLAVYGVAVVFGTRLRDRVPPAQSSANSSEELVT
ncbi:MFS transporter [Amycolatopsis rubida]|uniref:MFS transporter, FSR family, fosmidomycin resistance protein n=1 Tax=Amycolatopsis rubida TaxID=112413 RepID=A0A1I5PPQ7_9PSEU|nr:MFS transporter [Amycolatopsis rubida]SFP35867.1 MFS transporter, FSR family, fosmidomycin resistance protein [Amycolatopsis rubida]